MEDKLKDAEETLLLTKKLLDQKANQYNFAVMKDDGLDKNYHKEITLLKKEMDLLERTFNFWSNRVNFIKRKMEFMGNNITVYNN